MHRSASSSSSFTHETLTLSLPCHWLAPVLYGETESLSNSEQHSFKLFLRDIREDLGHGKPVHIGAIRDQPYFSQLHDAADYGVLPCECVDVDVIVER